jgi:hypothetical protein
LLRQIERRLFDELSYRVRGPLPFTAANVAIAGFRRMRDDTEGHELAVRGEFRRDFGSLLKAACIANDVIRRRHDQRRVRIDLKCLERRECHCRRRVAARRFQQNR